MTVVQQILYTAAPERWWALAEAMGFAAPFAPTAEWGEFHAGGVLALHRASDGLVGRVDIHVLVDDLDAAEARLADYEVSRGEMACVGELLTVRLADGPAVTVAKGGAAEGSGQRSDIGVQPIWYQPDIAEARAFLVTLGCRPTVVSSRGRWAEMRAAFGAVGLHVGAAKIGAGFETFGAPEALARRLQDAGFEASVVDEAWGKTVRTPNPDGGEDIWVSTPQSDMYGFRRGDETAAATPTT